MFRKTLVTLAVAALVTVGCSSKVESSAPAAVNTHCPIMGEPVEEDGGSIAYGDETVGFCCAKCIDKWEALDDDGKKVALETTAKGE